MAGGSPTPENGPPPGDGGSGEVSIDGSVSPGTAGDPVNPDPAGGASHYEGPVNLHSGQGSCSASGISGSAGRFFVTLGVLFCFGGLRRLRRGRERRSRCKPISSFLLQ